MDSLEWRVKKLENRLIGIDNKFSHVQAKSSITDNLNEVAKLYLDHNSQSEKYNKFYSQYKQCKSTLLDADSNLSSTGLKSQIELVLGHRGELEEHMKAASLMHDKAEKVLNSDNWIDLNPTLKKLSQIQEINEQQLAKSMEIDDKTGEYIKIYNDIIKSFKHNMVVWSDRLDYYESQKKSADEDV